MTDPRGGDLRQARDERGEVVAVEHLGGGLIELSARLPHLAAATRPGQFAQLRCGSGGSPLLRRPFSVAWTEAGCCSFVFAAVGEGTRRLAELRPGAALDALGPLGRGFRTRGAGRPAVCVAGGLGCAPFPILARALREGGASAVVVLSGAATAARLYPAERFRRGDGAIEVVEATEDGSQGRPGRVTELLEAELDGGMGVPALYGCGPNPMLAALARVVASAAPSALGEVSLEAPMGCGFGTCLGCALPVRDGGDAAGWALCCTDGPVMPLDRVDWGRLAELPTPNVA